VRGRRRFGKAEFDVLAGRLTVDGKKVELDRSGLAILKRLVAAGGQPVAKTDLMAAGWRGRAAHENSLAKAISAAMLAFALAACAGTNLASYEEDDFPACFIDHGAWAGEPRTTRYVEDSFHELDRHFVPFIDAVERSAREAADKPRGDWGALFEPLHIEAGANIVRLGRLLPRMERATDIAPMISQMDERQIWWPRGGRHTEYLRVAIAEEVVNHQNSSEHMARFLTRLSEAEALLLDLRSGDASLDAPARLHEIALALPDDWDAALFGFRRVIFDRPNMPVGESLSERLQFRVRRICEAYSTCGGEGNHCGGGGGGSDGLTGEPMEAPPSL